MGISDRLKQAAYAVGYGVGKAGKAIQDAAQDPRTQTALANAKVAVNKAADTAEAFADRMSPALREFADKASPVLQNVADKAAAAMKDAAQKAEPAVRQAAANAGAAASSAAKKAGATAKKAGASAAGSVKSAVTKAATENAAGMRAADARPHTVVDPKTGQKVVVEAYVKMPNGERDYNAVYPRGAMGDFGPLGNKAVGMLLVLAGVPMLVLPGPGVAAIAAGLYFLGKDGKEKGDGKGADASAGRSGTAPAAGSAASDDVLDATGVVVTDASDGPDTGASPAADAGSC